MLSGRQVVGQVKKVGKSRNFHQKVGKSRNISASDPAGGGGWGAKKHEIYVATFGSHLFNDLFVQGLGGPWPPWHPLDPLLYFH